MNNENIIKIENVSKQFTMGGESIVALKNVCLNVASGEFISIVGTSGSGKSTLMNIIGMLDLATSGTYLLDDKDVNTMNDDQISHYRNQKIGFVFQSFNLLPKCSAIKNVEIPLKYATLYDSSLTNNVIYDKAYNALKRVQLENRIHHRPNELSGGQRQRVAIARALVNNPKIILADEPTGALDVKTGAEILQLFKQLNEEEGVTIIIVTHDKSVAALTKKIYTMYDGVLSA